jgi:hypothetical protein
MLQRTSLMYTVTARTMVLTGILITTLGCHDASEPAAPPSVTAVGIKEEPNPLVRILSVELDQPAAIEIEYWTAAAPRLRVVQSTPATEHSVFLPRLRAGEVYDYEIRSLGAGQARGEPVKGQLRTDTLPSDLAGLRFMSLGSPSFPLVMVELRGEPFSGYVILDQNGSVVWYRRGVPESFTRRANGNFVLLEGDIGLSEIRPDHTVVAELPSTDSMHLHHDVLATPDNTLLAIARDNMIFDGEAWTGEAIWEWSPEQATVNRRWTAWDFLSPDTDLGPKSVPTDWLHANSLAYGPRGNVLVSFPSLNQIISIAPGFQSLEWRLGGPNATVALAADDEFWFQHTAREVAPGRVLLFDNGRDRPNGLFSRALELELDTAKGTATKVWEFRARPEIYAPIAGSARRLASGNTVINFATALGIFGATGPMAAYEVTAQERVTWILRIQGAQLVNYRATPLQHIGGESET